LKFQESCLHFISLHVHLLYSDVFGELPEPLQEELHSKCDLSWRRYLRQDSFSSFYRVFLCSNLALATGGSNEMQTGTPVSSGSEMDELMKTLELGDMRVSFLRKSHSRLVFIG
jgi:hypothetical protein